jgi:2-keto-4-pentenoate hydratase
MWRDVLKSIYEAQGAANRYAEVCERRQITPGDCERRARMASARGNPGEALAWAERGLALEKASRPGTGAGVALAEYAHVGVILTAGSLTFTEPGRPAETVKFDVGSVGFREANVTHQAANPGKTPMRVIEVELN